MEEMKERKIRARVISQKGTCVACHKVGDEFEISDICPANLCCMGVLYHFPLCAGT